MNVIKKIRNEYVPFVVLFVPLVIDIFNGIARGTDGAGDSLIGTLFRGGIILYSLKYLGRFPYCKYLFGYAFAILFSFSYHLIFGKTGVSELSNIIKVLYGYFVLAILLGNRQCTDYGRIGKYSVLYAVSAALSLVYCSITGAGYASYVEGTFGTKGFFIAMNDVCLSMLVLMGLSFLYYEKLNNKIYLYFTLIIALGLALVGSMSGYFGTLMILLAFALSVFYFHFSDYKSSKKQKTIVVLIAIFLAYFIIEKIVTIIMEDSYLVKKYSDLASTFFENSGREAFIDGAKKYISNQSFFEWLFGSGGSFQLAVARNAGLGNAFKSVESDFIDILGTYGILTLLACLWLPTKVLYNSIRLFIKNKSIVHYWIIVCCLIFFGHAYYGGHAFTSPLSMSYYVVVIYMYDKARYSNERTFLC